MPDKIVFFDIETGGLDHTAGHPIIQLAAVAVLNDIALTEVEQCEFKLQFDPMDCSPDALEKNSYDAEAWKREAISPSAAAGRFSVFLKNHATVRKISARTGRPYSVARMAGHNINSFDLPFLRSLFQQYAMFCPWENRCLDTYLLEVWLDQLDMIGGRPPQVGNYKLEDLCARYNVEPPTNAHDALADVLANVRVTRAQLRRRFGITLLPVPEVTA